MIDPLLQVTMATCHWGCEASNARGMEELFPGMVPSIWFNQKIVKNVKEVSSPGDTFALLSKMYEAIPKSWRLLITQLQASHFVLIWIERELDATSWQFFCLRHSESRKVGGRWRAALYKKHVFNTIRQTRSCAWKQSHERKKVLKLIKQFLKPWMYFWQYHNTKAWLWYHKNPSANSLQNALKLSFHIVNQPKSNDRIYFGPSSNVCH